MSNTLANKAPTYRTLIECLLYTAVRGLTLNLKLSSVIVNFQEFNLFILQLSHRHTFRMLICERHHSQYIQCAGALVASSKHYTPTLLSLNNDEY